MQTCVALSGNAHVVTYQFIDVFGQTQDDVYVTHGPVFVTNLSPATQTSTPFQCVKLRTRGVDASFSDPVILCGRDAPTFRITGSNVDCVETGLIWGDGATVITRPAETAPDAGPSVPPAWDAGMGAPAPSDAGAAQPDPIPPNQSDASAHAVEDASARVDASAARDAGSSVADATVSVTPVANADAAVEDEPDAAAQPYRHVQSCSVPSTPGAGAASAWAVFAAIAGIAVARRRRFARR